MSLNYKPLTPVLVKDPRVILDNERQYAVLEGGTRFTQKAWTSTSVSTSNINFSCPPPSSSHIIDRRVSLTLPVRIIFAASAVDPGYSVINPGMDAPRAFPIHSALDTVNLSINNCTVSQNMGEIIHALLRFNACDDLMELDYSETPAYLDLAQNYQDLFGTNRSELAMSGASPDGSIPARGAFSQYHVVYNFTNPNPPGGAALPGYAVVDCVFTEQIMLSPLHWGKLTDLASGFTNVTSNDWTFNFLNQGANRFWSHNNEHSVIPDNSCQIAFNNFVNLRYPGQPPDVNYQFFYGASQPVLNINYITPRSNSMVGPHTPIVYPYFNITKYATDTKAPIPYGIMSPIQSNNIQLSSIPRRVYVYAREENASYYANPSKTDTFYAIDGITVQFENNTGLFAQATQNQLWEMTRKNHCNISWQDWSGRPYYKEGGAAYTAFNQNTAAPIDGIYGGTGSVFCMEFSTDVGLSDLDAPGVGNSSYNLQIQANVRNCDPSGSKDAVNVSLYVLVVSEGSFTISESGAALTQMSILTAADVLEAKSEPLLVDYEDVQDVNGGNFMSGLKSAGKKILSEGAKANKFLKDTKLISKSTDLLSLIPGPQSTPLRGISTAANLLGYGAGGVVVGGNVVGGKAMKRKSLRDRAAY